MRAKYYISSFFWSTTSTIISALVNFIIVPVLLKYFGIDNYGVLTLAISTNAYIALLDIGSTGAIMYFSEWIGQNRKDLINRVARTSISFYGFLGVFNAILLLIIAWFGSSWFGLTVEQFGEYKVSLYILSAFSIFNWSTYVFSQLLIASEQIAFIHQVNTIRSVFNLLILGVTIWGHLSLNQYFFLFTFIQSCIIIPYYVKIKRDGLVDSFIPKFYWKDFSVVLKYSLAIFAMYLFQAMAAKSRPMILGIFADNASKILGEYRIIEVFPAFIITLCGALISIFLPKSSKYIANNDQYSIEKLAYEGTKLTSILTCLTCFPIMINAAEIITVYVGQEYIYLSNWMILWCATLVLNLYNSPIASLILASGKTKMLVYSSAIACTISMVVNALLCNHLGVGAVVIGYLVYIVIQQLFYYFYFNNRVMQLNSLRVLKSFIIPTFIAFLVYIAILLIPYNWSILSKGKIIIEGLIKASIWSFIYVVLIFVFRVITKEEILKYVKK